jgi:hypothetical protein
LRESVGNTRGFGNLFDNNHLTQVGDFDRDGRKEILMYSSSDGNWWIITLDNTCAFSSNRISWCSLGNFSGFGNILDGQHLIKFGYFYSFDRSQPKASTTILFNYIKDGNWFIGTLMGSLPNDYQFEWKFMGNTQAFGNLLDGKHLIVGGNNFGIGRDSLIMYSSSDGDW